MPRSLFRVCAHDLHPVEEQTRAQQIENSSLVGEQHSATRDPFPPPIEELPRVYFERFPPDVKA